MPRMLGVRQIEVVRAGDQQGSIAAAAAELGLSASTASHHISRLEEKAGVELLIRYPRGVRLTDAGRVVLRQGDIAREQLAIAERESPTSRRSRSRLSRMRRGS